VIKGVGLSVSEGDGPMCTEEEIMGHDRNTRAITSLANWVGQSLYPGTPTSITSRQEGIERIDVSAVMEFG